MGPYSLNRTERPCFHPSPQCSFPSSGVVEPGIPPSLPHFPDPNQQFVCLPSLPYFLSWYFSSCVCCTVRESSSCGGIQEGNIRSPGDKPLFSLPPLLRPKVFRFLPGMEERRNIILILSRLLKNGVSSSIACTQPQETRHPPEGGENKRPFTSLFLFSPSCCFVPNKKGGNAVCCSPFLDRERERGVH